MTTEHRKSPRRKIKSIERIGTWGNLKYHHLLECGHTEVRARASSAPKLACAWCLRVEDKKDELSGLVLTGNRTDENFDEMFIRQLDNESRVRAEIAKRLQVPVDAIDVTIDDISGIRAARVFFSPSDVSRMTGL
jgi:hypothetical protein